MLDVDKRGWMLGPMYDMHTGQLMVSGHTEYSCIMLICSALFDITLWIICVSSKRSHNCSTAITYINMLSSFRQDWFLANRFMWLSVLSLAKLSGHGYLILSQH